MSRKEKEIECDSNKIYNPKTKRCVLKTGKIGKELLSVECKKIKINWENNSCYLDSLLVALFHRKDKIIEELFLNAKLHNYNNPDLKEIGEKIKEELINIYKNITSHTSCKSLRKMLNSK